MYKTKMTFLIHTPQEKNSIPDWTKQP